VEDGNDHEDHHERCFSNCESGKGGIVRITEQKTANFWQSIPEMNIRHSRPRKQFPPHRKCDFLVGECNFGFEFAENDRPGKLESERLTTGPEVID
jgi:hypothetical protein